MVRVKFHCQNSEEIGVDENVMAKRITKSLKHESTAKETNSNGKFSVSGSLDNTTDTDVGIHFVVTITPTDSAMSAIVLDCFASENLRVLRMRGLDDSMIEGWVGRIEGEAGPLSPVAPKRRKDLPPLVVKPSLVYMFSTLKVETQKLILSFLKQLRIDDDLSFFVLCYGRTKEQEQYLQFLEQLVHFTDQGINIAALGLTSKQSPKKQWK